MLWYRVLLDRRLEKSKAVPNYTVCVRFCLLQYVAQKFQENKKILYIQLMLYFYISNTFRDVSFFMNNL
jgi:hypothetical protein